jgi:hypothetical protein
LGIDDRDESTADPYGRGAAALRAYERARDEAFPEPEAATFLVNSRGGPLDGHNIQHAKRELR